MAAKNNKNTRKANTCKKGPASQKNAGLRIKYDIIAILIVALGVFICASIFFDGVGVIGNVLKDVLLGIFGVAGFAIPFALLGIGLYMLFTASSGVNRRNVLMIALILVSIMSFIHLVARPAVSNDTVWAYYKEAYHLGVRDHRGGGVIGSMLTYPMQLLIGKVGSYIFFTASSLTLTIALTRFSIGNAAVKKVSKREPPKAPKPKAAARQEELIAEIDDVELYNSKKKRDFMDDLDDIIISAAEPRSRCKDDVLTPLTDTRSKRHDADIQIPDAYDTRFDANGTDQQFQTIYEVPAEEEPLPVIAEAVPASIAGAAVTADAEQDSGPSGAAIYQRPPLTLLKPSEETYSVADESATEKRRVLMDTLSSFNITGKIVNTSVGPAITRFEFQPDKGIRVNRITALSNDIALALAAPRVRIEAPIPGKAAIGFEVPNRNTAAVLLREVIESKEFQSAKSTVTVALGKDIAGYVLTADLERMPHLLIAGQTGSGKSVCINNIIISLVYKSAPDDLKMILIDPKVVELSVFSALPHLMRPVVTDPKKAAGALKWAVHEMEQRYNKMAKRNARDLARYNALQDNPEDKLPKLVIIIDELADLMMVAAKDVEDAICRIAQLGRAAGIHLVVATQSPRTDIITGLIKANIPSRIAFAVTNGIDSRVILDCMGAEKLLGKGDMLFHPNGANKPIRAQGAYVSDEEVEAVTSFFAEQNVIPDYDAAAIDDSFEPKAGNAQGQGRQDDELLGDAVKVCLENGVASISLLQRRLRVGYARAARLIDIMEQKKFISGFEGSKSRKLHITQYEYEQMFGTGKEGETLDG